MQINYFKIPQSDFSGFLFQILSFTIEDDCDKCERLLLDLQVGKHISNIYFLNVYDAIRDRSMWGTKEFQTFLWLC